MESNQNVQKKKSKPDNLNRSTLVIAAILILLLMLVLFVRECSEKKISRGTVSVVNDAAKPDTINDTLSVQEDSSIIDTGVVDTGAAKTDTVVPVLKPRRKVGIKVDTVSADTGTVTKQIDTTVKSNSDSLLTNIDTAAADPCQNDTVSPWVYPDPSGGSHEKPLKITFVSNELSEVRWRYRGETDWKLYDSTPVAIDTTVTIEFIAHDSCGNAMEQRSEYYEINRRESKKYCPDAMEYVKAGENRFCIDRYEWPNRKGARPDAYISKYGASDSCYSVGKRLCTVDEWMLSCMGPYSWKYPYGQLYERYACSTHDKNPAVSGSKPECRSFYGVYDMSGNLAEWTDTRAAENNQFYYVKGGFWESGPQSSCFEKRYSYYPQNRHNPVGFRCCADASGGTDGKQQ